MREVAPLAAAQRPNVSERVGEEAEEEPETTLSTYALMRGVLAVNGLQKHDRAVERGERENRAKSRLTRLAEE